MALDLKICPGAHWPAMVASLRALPAGPLGPAQLLVSKFLLEEEGNLQTYWIPFERLNSAARVAIVGLTPGWQQMTEAFAAARDALTAGMTDERLIMDYIERQAGFVGSMRTNMVRMLDVIGMSGALGLQSCAELFADQEGLVHGTSALRYPVFDRGEITAGKARRFGAARCLPAMYASSWLLNSPPCPTR